MLAKIHALIGLIAIAAYVAVETRGMVFTGTDAPPSATAVPGSGSGPRGRGGSGFFFIGGGK